MDQSGLSTEQVALLAECDALQRVLDNYFDTQGDDVAERPELVDQLEAAVAKAKEEAARAEAEKEARMHAEIQARQDAAAEQANQNRMKRGK